MTNSTITKEQAVQLAREAAAKHGHTLKDEPEQATVEFIADVSGLPPKKG